MPIEQMSLLWFAGTGALLGASGGLAPGPLTALVVGQTLRYGFKEGAWVSIAPVLTDGPLLLAGAVFMTQVQHLEPVLGFISLCGALFLLWLAWDTATASAPNLEENPATQPGSVRKSLMTNFLNPHPYLFWFVIGGPLTAQAFQVNYACLAAFLVSFFGTLVGAKILIAFFTARLRSVLLGSAYVWTMRLLGTAMLLFAGYFGWDAGIRFGLWAG